MKNEKICNKCGLTKKRSEFGRCKNNSGGLLKIRRTKSSDGLQRTCKSCQELQARLDKQFREIDTQKDTARYQRDRANGIESPEQIDGVIRELAELQYAVKKEYQERERRIVLINKYSDEAIEPVILHQMMLRRILEDFLDKQPPKVIDTIYRFGTLRYYRKKMSIELLDELAGQMRDKS
ncbi:MAG: hypothetical protein ABSH16_04960 [Sedimentisphaerales bacterium]